MPNSSQERSIVYFNLRKQLAISCLIILYITCIEIIQCYPDLAKTNLGRAIINTNQFLGINQSWNLFSPDVRRANFYCSAIITYSDGLNKIYELPRMNKLSLFERFQKQKMRKLFVDCWSSPSMAPFRPWEAKFIARCNDVQTSQYPQIVMVELCFNWSNVPPPSKWLPRNQLPQESNRQTYYVDQPMISGDLSERSAARSRVQRALERGGDEARRDDGAHKKTISGDLSERSAARSRVQRALERGGDEARRDDGAL